MIGEVTNHLWQSTLFAVMAGLLTATLRNNRAQVRYRLWFIASFKFFVPFSLLLSLGSHLRWTPVAKEIAPPAVTLGRWSKSLSHFPRPCHLCPLRQEVPIGSPSQY